jgi:hypothetical protein
MPTVDQFSDPAFGTLFRQVKRMPALEEFVKQAAVEPEEAKALPDSAFAWPSERKFPIHTPEHAALSYAYSKVASVIPVEVRNNIVKALEVYEVPETTFAEQAEKVASDEDQFLVPSLRLFRVITPAQCKYAQDDLVSSLHKLDLEHRAIACANLVKKADELKVELRPEVLQLAGLVVSSTKTAMEWIEARAARLPKEDTIHKLAYQTLAQGLAKAPAEISDRKGLLKFASAIAELDEKTGLDKHYDRRLPDALRTVFNTEKQASTSVDLGGTFVSLKKIAALPASFWEDLGGKELSDEVAPGGNVDHAKLATIVDTLPLDLKIVLKNQCR